MTEDSWLDMIEEVEEFQQLHEFMQDEDVTTALGMVRKFINKPDVPANTVASTINKLQGLSSEFQIKARVYTTVVSTRSGSDEAKRKNVYHTMSDAIDKLVAALKYSAR